MRKFSFNLSPFSIYLLLIAAPVPFLIFLFHFFFGLQKLEQLEGEMERIHTKMIVMQESQKKESALLSSLKNPDPQYLDKHVEPLTFLLPEIKKLEMIQLENPEEEHIAKRLQLLKDGGNRLCFSEEQIRANELFRETEEKQQQPIELNEEDLKKLLCLIEGVTIWPYGPKEGRPQLIIKDLKLTKKELSPNEKVYVVMMQLIKRENLEALR
jgi:tyrosyl-tRNA synthetase